MDNEGVKYRISLEDLFSGGIKTAHHNANNFEKAVGQITEKMRGLRGMILDAFIGYEIIRFGQDSVKAFEKIERSKAQLDNALKNRDVGFDMKELTEQAEKYAHKWIFSKSEIMAAQVELTKFKNLHGQNFERAEELGINIASRTGRSLSEVMNQVGRALSDPQHAARLLRPMGVSFTNAQEKMIRSMVETGHAAKAQDIIFKSLNETFKGSADAAAGTAEGMKKIAGHGWEEFQEKIGATIDKVEMSLLPIFQKELLPALDKFADWVGTHGDDITAFFEHLSNVVKFFASTISDALGLVEAMFDKKKYNWYMDTEGIHWDEKNSAWKKEHGYDAHHPVDQDTNPLGKKNAMFNSALMAKSAVDPVSTWSKALVNLGIKGKTNNDKGLSGDLDFGAGVSEPKASKIQNITITMQHVMENWKVQYSSTGEGVNDFKTKLLEALNSVVQDTAIIAAE